MESIQIIALVVVVLLIVGFGLVRTRRSRAGGAEIARARGGDLAAKLGKTSTTFLALFRQRQLDDDFWLSMEETLIGADVGVETSSRIVGRVRGGRPSHSGEARRLLADEVMSCFADTDRKLRLDGDPSVVLVVGVNGTGKTTSIAKLSKRLIEAGHRPLLAAADTFRAAADTQLRVWSERVGVEMVGGQAGGDPAAVAHDGLAAAKSRGRDVLIVDTAGRLHSKQNLMAELGKIRRVLERGGSPISEVLLVLDAGAGQNAIAQARQFTETVGVSGVILTKLDGTAKGGVVVAIEEQLGLPVKFIGIGEGLDDLVAFDPGTFVEALLGGSGG